METTRREFVAGGAASLVPSGGGWSDSIGETQDSVDRSAIQFLQEDFEGVQDGGYPDGWTAVANQEQEVIETDNAAEGSRCLVLQGEDRGCWEALADAPTRIPTDTPVRIGAWIGPVDDGTTGCHDHHASLSLRTATGAWDAGNGITLIKFQTDGAIQASDGTSLGTYEWGVWTRVEIEYERRDNSVIQTYWIDGAERGRIERPVRSYEDEFEYLRLGSGEYVVYYDAVVIESSDGTGAGDTGRTPTPTDPADGAGGGERGDTVTQSEGVGTGTGGYGGTSILDRIVDLVQTIIELGVLGAVGLLGYYFLVGIYQGWQSGGAGKQETSIDGGENEGVQYNEHGELIEED